MTTTLGCTRTLSAMGGRPLLALTGVLLLGPGCASAPAFHAQPADGPIGIAAFAWLAGTWTGQLDVGDGMALAETQYLPPEAGTMLGSFRLTKDGRVLVFELVTLVETEEGVEMRLRHFGSALEPWESGDPIVLLLEGVEEGTARFRNHVHDSPRWSYLTPLDGQRFQARSLIYSDAGEESRIDLTYERRRMDPEGWPAPWVLGWPGG